MARETCDICIDLIKQGTSINECLHKATEDVKPLIPVKTDENDKKFVIFFGSINSPVTIDRTIATKLVMPWTFGMDEDDGTLVTQTPTGESGV
ncbi:unnamed protein product [Thlaspi arvense]|uniref:Uncharacterized protein n=1 Tax=Thlaspi arvense TaxID=13288 RepID=A0AAU9T4Q1_THLAR|nr:unnamed protein product [Thlaspi arvense]